METLPCAAPAAYVPYHALAFTGPSEEALAVGREAPLPVTVSFAAASGDALAGSASESGIAGPFAPELGRPIWLTLSGTWSGIVTLMRSTDGGATLHPLTIGGLPWAAYSANANEPIFEESVSGAAYYLDLALTSGTLIYELAQ